MTSAKLKSAEGAVYQLDEAAAFQSGLVKRKVEASEFDEDGAVLLDGVDTVVLEQIVDYCKQRALGAQKEPNWDEEFLRLNEPLLFPMGAAAKGLEIEGLVHLISKGCASHLKPLMISPEEARQMFKM